MPSIIFSAKGGKIINIEEKIYLGNVEIKRIRQVDPDSLLTTEKLERYSLHVMDDQSRIATVHHWTKDAYLSELNSHTQLNTNKIRYQYGNHLGSASLELDHTGQIISYEEYFSNECSNKVILFSIKSIRKVQSKPVNFCTYKDKNHNLF